MFIPLKQGFFLILFGFFWWVWPGSGASEMIEVGTFELPRLLLGCPAGT